MRILVVIDTLGYGGAERLLVSLLPELQKQGVLCEVAVANAPYSLMPELEQAGIKVHCLDISHRWAIPEAVYKLVKICKQNQFDIIWGHLYFGNLYAAYTKLFIKQLKVLWTLHYKFFIPSNWREKFMLLVENLSLKYLVNKRVAVSEAVVASYPKWLCHNIQCIYNGIPVSTLPKKITSDEKFIIRKRFSISNSDFLIVVPARYTKVKGHAVLCDALALLKEKYNWHPMCIAAGNGPLKLTIQQKTNDLNLTNTVQLLDALPQNMLFVLMQSADAVVIPSIIEPFGIAAAEAMALGVPTILTNIDGFKELVGDSQAALLVEVNNSHDLSEKLWRLYTDENLREKLSIEGKNRITENFDINKISNDWINLFSKLYNLD